MNPRKHWVTLFLGLCAGILLAGCSSRPDDPSASNIPLNIEPTSAVGPVRAGMTTEQVLATLGKPERRTANALEYTHLGFAIMPDESGIVKVVMCGDVTGLGGPLVKAFTGRTKEGIGLTSTRDELIRAYGQPSSAEKMRGGTESMRYDSLGMTFTLENGKVYHMIVRLQPVETSIAVDPGASPPSK